VSKLRTVASALCIVLGALLIAAWAASWATLSAIEDSTVIEDSTARAIESEAAQDALVSKATALVMDALDDAGFDSSTPGVEGITAALIEAVVSSDEFIAAVHAQTTSFREQIVDELSSDGEGAIEVTIDLSAQVNARLGQIPVIGDSIPEISVPGIPVQVMDSEMADTARSVWDVLHFAKQWFGWFGLVFVVLGILVSHRRRWYFAKVALAVAVAAAILWLVVTNVEPVTLAANTPGGAATDAVIIEILRQAQGTVATTMAYVALGAMMVSLLLFILASRGNKGGQA
jgi:hypothetical protein